MPRRGSERRWSGARLSSAGSDDPDQRESVTGTSSRIIDVFGVPGFDPDALREKYREERDKRLRPRGNDQYIEVVAEFSDYSDDPYVEPGVHARTSRWDYRYTGGDSNGNLAGLAGKRVGIIGTGATAVQCIPHLGEWAGQLYVSARDRARSRTLRRPAGGRLRRGGRARHPASCAAISPQRVRLAGSRAPK